jgi:hypothetical protein
MTKRMEEIAREIVHLQAELDREIEQRRRALGWSIRRGLVEFERDVLQEHRRFKAGLIRFFATSAFASIVTAPIIYSMIIPLALLDAWTSLYQAVCFRAYGIERASRRDYISADRGKLAYLNWIEALNCVYCGYANGVIAFAREVVSRTEQYWCPIKHAVKISDPHQRYIHFLEFGDAEGYRERLEAFRAELAQGQSLDVLGESRIRHP